MSLATSDSFTLNRTRDSLRTMQSAQPDRVPDPYYGLITIARPNFKGKVVYQVSFSKVPDLSILSESKGT